MELRRGAQKQIEIYKAMTGQQRLRIGFQLWEVSLELMRSQERIRNPLLPEEEIEKKVRQRIRIGTTGRFGKDSSKD